MDAAAVAAVGVGMNGRSPLCSLDPSPSPSPGPRVDADTDPPLPLRRIPPPPPSVFVGRLDVFKRVYL